MTRTASSSGSAFARGGAIVSTLGLVGFSLVAASAASAATAADCTALNTVTAPQPASDIQVLLDDVTVPVVCIDGTFVLAGTLTVPRSLALVGLNGAVLDGDNAHRIIGTAGGAVFSVDGVTFVDGNAGTGLGGAIHANAALTITNSVFEGNSAVEGGGAIVARQTLTVDRSTFRSNAGGIGGAIWAYTASNVVDSTFVDNTATSSGGALVANGNTTVTNSTFVSNTTGGAGGAINFVLAATVVQSTFVNNSAGNGQSLNVLNSRPASIRGSVFATGTALRQLSGYTVTDNGGNVFTTSAAAETSLPAPAASSLFEHTIPQIFGANVLADNGGPTPTIALPAASVAIDVVPEGLPEVSRDQRGEPRSV
nr:hypothetical protein [Actinomycetota bacterium]